MRSYVSFSTWKSEEPGAQQANCHTATSKPEHQAAPASDEGGVGERHERRVGLEVMSEEHDDCISAMKPIKAQLPVTCSIGGG